MSTLSERLRNLRKQNKLTQKDIADFLGMSESGYGYYEQGRNEPSLETLRKLAAKYNVTVSYFTGENEKEIAKHDRSGTQLSDKDEKDIAKRLEQIRNDIEHSDGLSFSGEPMSEEAKDSLMEAMEFIVRQTKKINKKYIPKKYRKDDSNE